MRKKMVGIILCLMLITIIVPTSKAFLKENTLSDDVEIEIFAGHLKKDIGFGIQIYVLNHKFENITCYVNIEYDFIFRNYKDFTHEFNFDVPTEKPWSNVISTRKDGIKFITVTASADDTILTRSGISISKIMIFTD